jgi:predicted small secreted protein
MKKRFLKVVMLLAIAVIMTSCYTITFSVGRGARTGQEIRAKNHYLIGGLVPLQVADVSFPFLGQLAIRLLI